MKTSELTGPALDWAVGTALKLPDPYWNGVRCAAYSTDWSQGGPIFEREIGNYYQDFTGECYAHNKAGTHVGKGPTTLIAAMRCFVASRLGESVEIPEELK